LFAEKTLLWGKKSDRQQPEKSLYLFSSEKGNFRTLTELKEAAAGTFRPPSEWNAWEEYVDNRFKVLFTILH
jgi:hypothetical protein